MTMVNAESLLVFWHDGYWRFIKGFTWGDSVLLLAVELRLCLLDSLSNISM